MKSRAVIAALLVGLMTACQTQDPREAQTAAWLQSRGMSEQEAWILTKNRPALRQYITNIAMEGQDDRYCRSLGASAGSNAYVQCRSHLASSRVTPDRPVTRVEVTNKNTTVYESGWPAN